MRSAASRIAALERERALEHARAARVRGRSRSSARAPPRRRSRVDCARSPPGGTRSANGSIADEPVLRHELGLRRSRSRAGSSCRRRTRARSRGSGRSRPTTRRPSAFGREQERGAVLRDQARQHRRVLERLVGLEDRRVREQEGRLQVDEDLLARVDRPLEIAAVVGVVQDRAARVRLAQELDRAQRQPVGTERERAAPVDHRVQVDERQRGQRERAARRAGSAAAAATSCRRGRSAARSGTREQHELDVEAVDPRQQEEPAREERDRRGAEALARADSRAPTTRPPGEPG